MSFCRSLRWDDSRGSAVSNTIPVIRAILPVTRAPAETTMPRNEDAPLLFGGGACLGGSAQVRRDRSRSNRRVHRRRFGSRRCTCRSGGPRTYHRSTCGRRLDATHAGRGSGGSRTRTVEPPMDIAAIRPLLLSSDVDVATLTAGPTEPSREANKSWQVLLDVWNSGRIVGR